MTDQQALDTLALSLVNEQSTMALATARGDHAWTAPVYFVFHNSAFYFFSSPESRHINEATDSGQASAAIYPSVRSWQEIKGIQMSGRIQSAGLGLTSLQAIRAYIAKFPFTKEFFEPGQDLNLENFAKRFRVSLYRFDPDQIFYMDNQIKFGYRVEVTLHSAHP
jgi:uncharacterized protein YhbP (UPF0306 family)